jgi:SRSO17 transposase
VQRQYLGCVGKIDNGIVTVHLGVAKGTFQALLDAELYLPKSWNADRTRCHEAGIPQSVRYRPKWQIAYEQLVRLDGHGVHFDWLVFDEGYGSKVPLLRALDAVSQRFVGEVPVNFSVKMVPHAEAQRADCVLGAEDAKQGQRFRLSRKTVGDTWWRATSRLIESGGCRWRLVVAINESTGEVKYFVTNAVDEPLGRVLRVAFRRATIEHSFRVAKSEAGLTHYEGRQYVGLVRHLILSLVVLGFVSLHTDRLRGEKPACDDGASVPGVKRAVPVGVPPKASDAGDAPCWGCHPLPPKTQPAGHGIAQETAA